MSAHIIDADIGIKGVSGKALTISVHESKQYSAASCVTQCIPAGNKLMVENNGFYYIIMPTEEFIGIGAALIIENHQLSGEQEQVVSAQHDYI